MKQRTQPQRIETVLGWGSPFDMVCKLDSELRRINDAKMLSERIEHAMNFAFTAYHLIEWVWTMVERVPKDEGEKFEKDSWIAVIGFQPKTGGEVRRWALTQCPEIEYCRQLANATKHLSCRLIAGASASKFAVAATDKWAKKAEKEPFSSILDEERAENWKLLLVDGQKQVDLVEIFRNQVFKFWSELAHRIYIGESY